MLRDKELMCETRLLVYVTLLKPCDNGFYLDFLKLYQINQISRLSETMQKRPDMLDFAVSQNALKCI